MSALNKWEAYVERYGRAEADIRQHIAKWRSFKKFVSKQRYENSVPQSRNELFSHSPFFYLDNIRDAKIRLKYCELKIKYYKEIELNGETVANHKLRNNLLRQLAQMLQENEEVLSNM